MISNLFAGVSVDTNVFIHLYKSGYEGLLFDFFQEVCVHEYIIETELKRNDIDTYNKVKQEIQNERSLLYTNKDIVNKGLINIFSEHFEDYKILFAGDLGEAYAVALSSALGIPSFVSNDVKDGGPHETLVKEFIEDVIPFAFYELLFLQYLKGDIDTKKLKESFECISKTMKKPMNFKNRIKESIRRFVSDSERDKKILKEYSTMYNFNVKQKIIELRDFINSI